MQGSLNKLQPCLYLQKNTEKTLTLYQPPPGKTSIDPHVEIYGTPLKSVKNFICLGSTVASDNTIDVEINNRVQVASAAFGGLWKRVLSQHGISVSNKVQDAQGNYAFNTNVLSRHKHSLLSPF